MRLNGHGAVLCRICNYKPTSLTRDWDPETNCHKSCMEKYMKHRLKVLYLVGFLLCFALPLSAGMIPAEHNFSSYEVSVFENFCEGATPVFVDELPKPDDRTTLGLYRGYLVVMQDNHPPYILESVMVVAVKTTLEKGVTVAEVLEHECAHHRQRLRYPDYFTFLAAYQATPSRFEHEADAIQEMRQDFRVARVGKTQEPVRLALTVQ